MRLWFGIIILLFYSNVVYSQYSKIYGVVTDTANNQLSHVTITLKQTTDSSIVAYSFTNNKGEYSIEYLPGNYYLQISYMGYSTIQKTIKLKVNESLLLNFALSPDPFLLNQAVVKARSTGIKFDKDTIRYNLKTFVDGSEVVLGDVLKKLPGIEVEDNGSIIAHGKKVDGVLLNGQDFFMGNTQMATKNLPADIAENVEVLNNYSEYSMLGGFQSHEKTMINVGVNKDRLGKLSGNIRVGGGYEDKFLGSGNLLLINSKFMSSFVGAINNLGEEVFSFEDYFRLQGGINELKGDNSSHINLELTDEEKSLLISPNNVYKRTNGLGALNFAYQPKQTLKLTTYLLFNNKDETAEDLIQQTYTLAEDKSYKTLQHQFRENHNKLYSGQLKFKWDFSKTTNVTYKGMFSNAILSEDSDSKEEYQKDNLRALGYLNSKSFSTRHDILLLKQINRHLLSVKMTLSYADKPLYSDIKIDSLLLPLNIKPINDWYFNRQNINQKQLNLGFNLAFLYKLNQSLFIKSSLNIGTARQNYYSDMDNNDMNSEDDVFVNDFKLGLNDYSADLGLVKNKGLFRFRIGAIGHFYSYGNKSIHVDNMQKFKINPSCELSLFFTDKHIFTLNFSESDALNQAGSFITGMVINSYKSYSNDSKMNYFYNTKYNISMIYRIFDLFSNTMFITTGGYNRITHSNSRSFQQNGLLIRYQPYSSEPIDNIYTKFVLRKGLGFSPLIGKLSAGYNYNSFSTSSQGINNDIKNHKLSTSVELVSNFRSLFDFEVLAEIEYYNNNSTFSSTTQTIQRYMGKTKWKILKNLYTDLDLEYIHNKTYDNKKELYNLNASIRYILSKAIEFELTGRNILHLNKQEWVSLSYNGVYIYERYYRQIPGSIMFKMNIKF